jgi:hypothetical protein
MTRDHYHTERGKFYTVSPWTYEIASQLGASTGEGPAHSPRGLALSHMAPYDLEHAKRGLRPYNFICQVGFWLCIWIFH